MEKLELKATIRIIKDTRNMERIKRFRDIQVGDCLKFTWAIESSVYERPPKITIENLRTKKVSKTTSGILNQFLNSPKIAYEVVERKC